MVTEMMLLISIRQRNWEVARELAEGLDEKDGLYRSVGILASRAGKQDLRAVYLLGLWSKLQWESKR